MTTVDLGGAIFPKPQNHVHARWAAILLEPIAGSYERLVIGCAVVGDDSFHLEMANALNRLHCLYGSRADGVSFAVEMAGKAIEQDLARRGISALEGATGPLSGVHIGPVREAEGNSLVEIAQDWMAVLSSFYDRNSTTLGVVEIAAYAEPATSTKPDRLPQLVLEHVTEHEFRLSRFFSERVVSGKTLRQSAAHKLDIDFKGSRLVANFATLNASRLRPAVGNIKQRLWDLKIDREQDFDSGKSREHELIIQVPRPDDPQISVRQYKRLEEEYEGLLEQADQLSLLLRQFNTPTQIGQHIIHKEAA